MSLLSSSKESFLNASGFDEWPMIFQFWISAWSRLYQRMLSQLIEYQWRLTRQIRHKSSTPRNENICSCRLSYNRSQLGDISEKAQIFYTKSTKKNRQQCTLTLLKLAYINHQYKSGERLITWSINQSIIYLLERTKTHSNKQEHQGKIRTYRCPYKSS